MNASAKTGEYQEKSRRKRCWAAGSTRTCVSPTTPTRSPARSVKYGDRLDLHEKARFGQPLHHHQRAGWVGCLRKDFVARLSDERPIRPVGDVRVRPGQVARSRPVMGQYPDNVA